MGAVEETLVKFGIAFDKPRNGWLWAKCPYHEDSEPSWRIRITPFRYGQHHCFSCKEGGTLIDLVMHKLACDFPTARAWLSGNVEEEPKQEELPDVVEIQVIDTSPAIGFKLPRDIVFEPLEKWPSPPRNHVEKRRGMTAAQVSRFRIGYALQGRLEGRVVIPIWAVRKNVLRPQSYMARDFTDSKDPDRKRYLFPSAKEMPNSDVFFGEMFWPPATERNTIILAEGAFNALAWERVVSPYDVAIAALGGSYVRPMHVLKLSTFKHVIIVTDDDLAGNTAAKEIETSLALHTKTTRVRLKKDADEMTSDELWHIAKDSISIF